MRFAVLRGLARGNVFWAAVGYGEADSELVKAEDGTVAYHLLGVYDSPEEAQDAWAVESRFGVEKVTR